MKLSIIIVSYNVKEFLSKCVLSVQNNFSEAEIIVVDNNSSDGSIKMLSEHFSHVKIISNKTNKGFSGANNQGIAMAQSENILLLNPDTEIVNGALNKILEFMNAQKKLCIVGPKLLNSDCSLQISCWKFSGLAEMFLEIFYLHTIFNLRNYSQEKMKKAFECDALSGAALLFKKELVNKIGNLDEKFFWSEDVDFCYRAKKAGASVIYFPQAEIVHHSGKSSKSNQHIVIANQLISKLKFEKKHGNIFSFFLGCIFTFAQIISRIVILLLLSPLSNSMRIKFNAYFYSLRKFFSYIFRKQNAIL